MYFDLSITLLSVSIALLFSVSSVFCSWTIWTDTPVFGPFELFDMFSCLHCNSFTLFHSVLINLSCFGRTGWSWCQIENHLFVRVCMFWGCFQECPAMWSTTALTFPFLEIFFLTLLLSHSFDLSLRKMFVIFVLLSLFSSLSKRCAVLRLLPWSISICHPLLVGRMRSGPEHRVS